MDLTEFAVQRDGYLAGAPPPRPRSAPSPPARSAASPSPTSNGRARRRTARWCPGASSTARPPPPALADEIAAMPVRRTRGTSISRALYFATVLIEDDAIDGARRVIDVSGDGANNVGPPVVGARDEAVARGITINGLPIVISAYGAQRRPRPLLRGLRHRRRGRLRDGRPHRRGARPHHPPQADPRDQRPRPAARASSRPTSSPPTASSARSSTASAAGTRSASARRTRGTPGKQLIAASNDLRRPGAIESLHVPAFGIPLSLRFATIACIPAAIGEKKLGVGLR